MNFDLTDNEAMLKTVAERFVVKRYDADNRRSYQAHPNGFSQENWSLLGDLGMLGAPFRPESGGLGIGAAGLAAMFEVFGKALVVEPVAENIVLAGSVLEDAAPDRLKADWLDGLVSGRQRIALAHREYKARRNSAWVETEVLRNSRGLCLSGRKSCVPAGAGVDAFIVSARSSGTSDDRDGVSLFLVHADAPGLTARSWRLVDGGVAVTLDLDNVPVSNGAILEGGLSAIDRAQLRALLARSAEALGIMDWLFQETLTYMRTRKQFGVTLGSFQALQHRMVAQYAILEQARGLLHLATIEQTPVAIHGARAFIAEASLTFGHEMIQFHGGMGVSDELQIGHGHKRLVMLSRWPEGPQESLDHFTAASSSNSHLNVDRPSSSSDESQTDRPSRCISKDPADSGLASLRGPVDAIPRGDGTPKPT